MSTATNTTEIGATGLRGGTPGEGWLYEEVLPELRGAEGARRMRQFAENDTVAGAALLAFSLLLRSVRWRVDPSKANPVTVAKATRRPTTSPKQPPSEGAPPPPDPTPPPAIQSAPPRDSAVAAKRLFEEILFQDMSIPFGDVITNAAEMFTYGYMPMEIVLKLRRGPTDDPLSTSQFTDRKWGIAKLAPRSPETIQRHLFNDAGDWLGLEQWTANRAGVVTIPAEKLLNFRTTSRHGTPVGRAVGRTAYVTWTRKEQVEQAEGRMVLRQAGLPMFAIPEEYLAPGADDRQKKVANAYRALADAIAKGERGSLVVPGDRDEKGNLLYEFKYIALTGQPLVAPDVVIRRQQQQIAVSMLADFLLLGQDKVGSFALASTKTDLFTLAVAAMADTVAEQFNMVLIPRLCRLNGIPAEDRPMLAYDKLQQVDLAAVASFISATSGAGAALFPSADGSLERAVLGMAGLPVPGAQQG